MRIVAWDTETALIRPGRIAPLMTCLTYQTAEEGKALHEPLITHACFQRVGEMPVQEMLIAWLTDPSVLLVGQHVPFDLAVICAQWPELLPLVVNALDDDRITDTKIRQQLLDIASGCFRGRLGEDRKWIKYDYSLDALTRRLAGRFLKKDGFRLFYAFFREVPLDAWVEHAKKLQARAKRVLSGEHDAEFELFAQGTSKKDREELVNADPTECIKYPLEDARATLDVFLVQEEWADPYLADQFRQTRTAFWNYLTSAWGLRTNPVGVARLQVETEKACNEVQARLIAAGLVRADGSRDTKAAKQRMLDTCGWHWDEGLGRYEPNEERLAPLRLTDTGEPSLDSDACKAVDDSILRDYAELTSLKAVGNKDIPALARATVYPIHTSFGMAETGRRTSSNPNVQNWRRLPGIRECFVPRPGKVFAQADYSSLELCTLAQACIDLLRKSALGEALNAGLDAHTALACAILNIADYKEGERLRKTKDHTFDNARQTAKVANFGFPGGLGAEKLILFARKTYQTIITVEEARELKRQWFARWPEMPEYFAFVNSLIGGNGFAELEQLRSKRIRAGATYTAACNSFFQGLGADATGHAGWLVMKACYVDKNSPLFGSRIVNYVHDELIVESDEAVAPEAAEELSRLMVKGAQEWIPDVKLTAEPCLMRVWSKDAKTLRNDQGRLVPWSPSEEKKAA